MTNRIDPFRKFWGNEACGAMKWEWTVLKEDFYPADETPSKWGEHRAAGFIRPAYTRSGK